MGKYEELATTVIDLVGGKANITAAWHCVTRLRFNLADTNKVKIDEIKKVKGVMGAQFSGEQFQVIIGNSVSKVFADVEAQLGTLSAAESESKDKGSLVGTLMDTISGIFTPIMPAMIGTGLLKGFLTLVLTFNLMSAESTGYQVLTMIGDCAFYFMPFLLAVSSARRFKTNEFLAMCVAGVLLYPTMINGYNASAAGEAVTALNLFGILPIPYLNYSSSVIPIILATYLMSHVYKLIKRIMPEVLTTMFSPLITLIIVIPITLIVLGPIGTYIGGFLAQAIEWLFGQVGFIAAALVGACYPLLVMTGMHWGLSAFMINSFMEQGFDSAMMPAMLAATFAMAGATFGVFLKTKSSDMKQVSLSAGISAIIGITEPAMYGVTLKLKKPFYAAMAGGGLAAIVLNLFNVKNFGMSMPGLIALAGYADPENSLNLIVAVAGSVIAFVAALILVWVLGFQEDEDTAAVTAQAPIAMGKEVSIHAPVSGKIVPVETLSDATFAEQIMGYTVAIEPSSDRITSPVEGEVVMIAETQHAIGLKSSDGLEVLVHLGIDTVELKGQGFTPNVSCGDQVVIGTELMTVDTQAIKAAGFDPVVLTIVTNAQDYLKILPVYEKDDIQHAEKLSSAIS